MRMHPHAPIRSYDASKCQYANIKFILPKKKLKVTKVSKSQIRIASSKITANRSTHDATVFFSVVFEDIFAVLDAIHSLAAAKANAKAPPWRTAASAVPPTGM